MIEIIEEPRYKTTGGKINRQKIKGERIGFFFVNNQKYKTAIFEHGERLVSGDGRYLEEVKE